MRNSEIEQSYLFPEVEAGVYEQCSAWSRYVDAVISTAALLRNQALDAVLSEPFDWQAHSTKIVKGTKVAYAKKFLRSIGVLGTDPMWHARGWVVGFKGLSPECNLASVTWRVRDRPLPGKVNVKNLARVGPNLAFCGD